MRPYMLSQVRPYVLSPAAAAALKPGATFRECAKDCPEMIVISAGAFVMGSPASEPDRKADEGPQRQVVIAKPFAVSIYNVTFDDWDACVKVGGCPDYSDGGMGRGRKPMVHVTWDDAQNYVAWFSLMTGAPYRLLSEAEWEYAARAGTTTPYYWGAEIGKGNANCVTCGSAWDDRQTSPVGSFAPNKFGLYDMAGDVWQWTHDCYHADYSGAPADGSAWTNERCWDRVARGGAYRSPLRLLALGDTPQGSTPATAIATSDSASPGRSRRKRRRARLRRGGRRSVGAPHVAPRGTAQRGGLAGDEAAQPGKVAGMIDDQVAVLLQPADRVAVIVENDRAFGHPAVGADGEGVRPRRVADCVARLAEGDVAPVLNDLLRRAAGRPRLLDQRVDRRALVAR